MKRILTLALLCGFVLGVSSAAGRSLATTTITVEVIGKGLVTSPDGLSCGDGRQTCYLTFSGDVTLTESESAAGWSFAGWTGCSASGATCDVSGVDATVTATFAGPPTTTSTLSVSFTGAGDVSGPSRAPHGSEIDCGSAASSDDPSMYTEPDCSWTVPTGSTLTVFETPDTSTGNVFSGWGGACTGTSVACTVGLDGDKAVSATWTAANAAKTLTVAVAGNGTVTGGGLTCAGPATCVVTEPVNGTVTLQATPKEGYVFMNWSGGPCSGTVSTCTMTVNDDTSITATFGLQLTVKVAGSGNVTGALGAINCGTGADVCSAAFATSSTPTVTLVATPATGATFTGWTGACGGTATTCTVLMSSAKTVTATFGSGLTLTVAVTGNGTVTGGGVTCGVGGSTCSSLNQAANAAVTLTATPSSGATFSGWGGACSGTTPTCTVSMTTSKSVTATFQSGTSAFPLSVSVSGSGVVTGAGITCRSGGAACSTSSAAGSSVTLTEAPERGGTFTGWGGACSGTAKNCTVTMDAAKSVSATFTAGAPGTLTLAVSGRGTVSGSLGRCAATGPQKTCIQHYKAGAKANLTATPLRGASFLGWGDSCVGRKTACSVTLTTAKSVTARFSGSSAGSTTTNAVLASRGAPVVRSSATGFRVTLRFTTSVAGVARVRGLRAGRVMASLSLRVAPGRATIGPFPVVKAGLYSFRVSLAGRTIQWKTCLGLCRADAEAGAFLLVGEQPEATRTGDAWSVTLHYRASNISDARIQVSRGRKGLINKHFLGHAGAFKLGPFLLGPGNYTVTLTAADPYGRVRKVSSVVALAS